jgi:putative ubiquitin-RnfH superfamily antitoxin RatB of RatAB toxin-antitoxin module
MAHGMTETLNIEVVYALPKTQKIVALQLQQGATVRQAIEASGLLKEHPEIDLAKNKLGIFAKLTKPETELQDRDRVEIYRPLLIDPKEVRKQRSAASKHIKKNRRTNE